MSRNCRRLGKRVALLASVLLLCFVGVSHVRLASAADIPLDQLGFTNFVARAFARALPDATVSVPAPLYLVVDVPKVGKSKAYLQTLYSQCRRDPGNCELYVTSWVAQITANDATKAPPLRRSKLRIVVRPVAYVDLLRRSQKQKPVAAPFLAGLWMICASDEPTVIEFPKATDITALGLSREEALDLCRRNTASALRPILSIAPRVPTGRVGLITDDPYVSSRILFADSWQPLAAQSRGRLLVSIPGSDVVLYTQSESKRSIKALERRTLEVMSNVRRPFSPTIYRWTPAGFVVLKR